MLSSSDRTRLVFLTIFLCFGGEMRSQDYTIAPSDFAGVRAVSRGSGYAVSGFIGSRMTTSSNTNGVSIQGQFQSLISSALRLPSSVSVGKNPGLEDIGKTFVFDGNKIRSLPVGSGNIAGWVVTNAEIAWIDDMNPWGPTSRDNSLSLDLTGYHDRPPYGGITQTIDTKIDQIYELSLDLGSHKGLFEQSGPMTVQVLFGEQSAYFTLGRMVRNEDPKRSAYWRTFRAKFIATQLRTAVTILGTQSYGGNYLGLDNVHVYESIPYSDGSLPLPNNPGLESTDGQFYRGFPNIVSLPEGSALIPGWLVVQAEIAWGDNENIYGPKVPKNSMFVDLTGFHDALPYGGITRFIATRPGREYTLSLDLGMHLKNARYRGPISVRASFGEATASFRLENPQPEPDQPDVWKTFSHNFKAVSTLTKLTIVGTESGGGQFLGLDNVRVNEFSSQTPDPVLSIEPPLTTKDSFQLSFIAKLGLTYSLQSVGNLTSGLWPDLPGSEIVGTGQRVNLRVPISTNQVTRFYRLVESP